MASDAGGGCRCWLRSFFSPVSNPPCQTEGGVFEWRKCHLPALEKGVSSRCPFKPLLTIGILWVEFLRRLFIPSASAFVVYAKAAEEKKPPGCDKLVKANDLPLYAEKKGQRKEPEKVNDNSVLVTTIRCMRQEFCFFMQQVEVVKQELSEVYLTGKAHTQSTLEYLREPDNLYPRVGAITAGALTGYLLAMRKGRFKKLIYMGAGAGTVSAILYPQEAQYYAEESLKVMKKYVIIAYHFLNGDYFAGKPLELEPPKKTKQKYVPNKLQQEYLDIQSSLESDDRCVCKDESEESEN